VGVLPDDLRALPPGGPKGEAYDLERILREHRLSPEVRDTSFERPVSGQGSARRGPQPATQVELQPGNDFPVGRGLGGGGISLVGAAEGAAAAVDAVDSEAVSRPPRDCAAIAVDQSPADGSPAAGEQVSSVRCSGSAACTTSIFAILGGP
jgi:hypothetical protein